MKKSLTAAALALSLAIVPLAYAADDADSTAPADQAAPEHAGKGHYMDKVLSGLPEKDAALVRNSMKQVHEQNKPLMEQAHKLRKDLYDIATAASFDKNAYLAKTDELNKLYAQMKANMDQAKAANLAQLPQSERKTLADAMKHHRGMHKGRHHHKNDKSQASSATPADDTGAATPAGDSSNQ